MREIFRREIRREKVGQNAPFYTTVTCFALGSAVKSLSSKLELLILHPIDQNT